MHATTTSGEVGACPPVTASREAYLPRVDFLTTAFCRLCSKRPKDASFLAGEQCSAGHARGRAPGMDARDGDRRSKAAHTRAAETHARAAELHEESASFHEEHACEMWEKGLVESAERAERIADRERELADEERGRAAKHRRSAEGESDSVRPGAELGALAAGVYGVWVVRYGVVLEGEAF